MISKKSLNRKLFSLIVVLSLLFLVCLPAFAAEGEKVTINVLGVQDPMFFAVEEILSEFEEETGIKVNLEALAYDALMARLTTSFVTKESGNDVAFVDNVRLAQLAENKWIIPLTDLIRRDKQEVKMNEFVPAAIYSISEHKGDIYTMPIGVYSQLVMYRTDLLEKAGLKPPPIEFADWWTWDTYMDYVKKLDALGDDIYGTVICGAQPIPVVHMYTGLEVSRGVRWFKSFPRAPWDFTPTINTEKSVETLKYYLELYKYSPPESINFVWMDAGTAFSKQDIGIFYWWSPYSYLIRHAGYMVEEPSPNVGKYGYAAMPYQPGEDKIISSGGWGMGIPQYSDKKEAAWKFIKWFSSAEGQKKMGLTKLKSFDDFARKPLFEDEELLKYYPELPVHLDMLTKSDAKLSRPQTVIYPTLEGIYGLLLNTTLSGQITPEKAMADAQSQFENVLKQNNFLPYEGESYDQTLEKTIKLIEELSP